MPFIGTLYQQHSGVRIHAGLDRLKSGSHVWVDDSWEPPLSPSTSPVQKTSVAGVGRRGSRSGKHTPLRIMADILAKSVFGSEIFVSVVGTRVHPSCSG